MNGSVTDGSGKHGLISPRGMGRRVVPELAFFLGALSLGIAALGRADICMLDMWSNGTVAPGFVYPNWNRVKAGSFDVMLCMGCTWQSSEQISGVTVLNFGSAPAADIKAVYWEAHCSATTTGLQTMTFRGTYTGDSGPYPAWTWAGATVELSACPEMYVGGPSYFTMDIFFDVAACPTPEETIVLGFSSNSIANTTWWGSVWDNSGCAVPWGDAQGALFRTIYVYKEANVEFAAPGDTITYTVYYGRPGTSNLSGVEIVDTQPPYTHYVNGSASPVPDSGWDPDFGPPLRLKWTILPPHPVFGGNTDMVTFDLSVDWGNGEGFEPGSGDVAAPEGERLNNQAAVSFLGMTGCSRGTVVNPPVTTVARRFLFWKIGDNDVLYAPTLGQPADEMIYSIFMKNMSAVKTWWRVDLWDTVPAVVDVWGADSGFEDPCVGWTMTPTGCAGASPGWRPAGTTTLLTWKLDMPPGMTLTLRWKGKVRPTASPGQTAISQVSIHEMGWTGVMNGTGNSVKTRKFGHLAPVILQTTYTSYVGMAAADVQYGCAGHVIPFFPLNKRAQFELRGIQYSGPGWSTTGGVSQTIGCMIGDCLGGFFGNAGCNLGSGTMAIPGGGNGGCRAERIPALYDPIDWKTVCPAVPFNFVYKLTSNAPLAWQLLTRIVLENDDRHTYAPASTLSYTGLLHYAWRLSMVGRNRPWGDSLSLISTGKDAYGNYDPTLATTVHLFSFDFTTQQWDYFKTYELAGESQAYDQGTSVAEEGAWRTISSDVQLIVNHGMSNSDLLGNKAWVGNNFSAMMPTRQTGNLVSAVGSGSFYGLVQTQSGYANTDARALVGNVGTLTATYEIWRYLPDNTVAPSPRPGNLNGTSGRWIKTAQIALPAGQPAAGNPHWFDYMGSAFNISSLGLFKVELLAGGPIQVISGAEVEQWGSGGSVVHAEDGQQTGAGFWIHLINGNFPKTDDCLGSAISTVNIYCSKSGMAVRANATGYSATYTTGGKDQCISFRRLTTPAAGTRNNYRFNVLPGGSQGNVIMQYIMCLNTQKGYTAPFLQEGVHYQIITPPVVYAGQSFWITVVVLESSGTTKEDYNGVTSFSATDSSALIEGAGMDSYDFTWDGCPTQCGVRIFVRVTFNVLGLQTIVAVDTLDGSISGVTSFMVVGADVKLSKEPRLSILSSGETVQFRICWSNYSSATAANFTITDAVPMGTSYVPEAASLMFCGAGGPATPSIIVAYGGASVTTPGTFNTLTSPTQTAPATTRWLRWTIRDVYVYSTGCVCFRTRVD